MKIKAVIFDLDGTIAKFNIDYRAVRAEVRSLLIRAGMPASTLSINESIFEMLKKTEIFMKNTGQTAKAIDQIHREALEIAEKYELEAAKYTTPFPGVKETLTALKEMGLKIGLCTINSEKSTEYILKRFRINEFFDALTPRNKVKNVKPNTEHLETTLKALDVKPQETVVIGDSAIDMKCAKDLGAIAVGIPTGVSSPKELINSGASYIITSITDLLTLIGFINKNMEEQNEA
ncbi:MAG: HAD family hydrolase [Candidatus Bathyarchaeia archaeon]